MEKKKEEIIRYEPLWKQKFRISISNFKKIVKHPVFIIIILLIIVVAILEVITESDLPRFIIMGLGFPVALSIYIIYETSKK